MSHSPEALVSRWIDSFNARDLDGLLACMGSDVRFYPLRLGGLDRRYRGHKGVCRWFERMDELEHRHRIAVHGLSAEPSGEVVAIGELYLEDHSDPTRFWARDRVEDGRIVVAHHYLTDPEIFAGIERPWTDVPPPRLPGS